MRLLPRFLLPLLALLFAAPAAAIPQEELDVPYVPTPMRVVDRMLDLAELRADEYLIDLGSGDGRIPIAAAMRGARALGVDIDPARVREAQAAARLRGVETRARFRRQDLFATPIAQADVVTLYLLPDINLRLRPRLLTELRPGTRILSHQFDLGDWRPDASEELDSSRIRMWIVPAVVGGAWTMRLEDGTTLPLVLEQRFQEVTGTLGAVPLAELRLRGSSFRFKAGDRIFEGVVRDATIEAAPGSGAGWTATRAD
ncbi:MAG TPA: 50S ribosomal protein L11 methyltransferase [Allosphingosinicella sp.]|jgi:SAM-dependent methyltransferase